MNNPSSLTKTLARLRCQPSGKPKFWNPKNLPLEGEFLGRVKIRANRKFSKPGNNSAKQNGIKVRDDRGQIWLYYETVDISNKLELNGTEAGHAIRIEFLEQVELDGGKKLNVFDLRSSPIV